MAHTTSLRSSHHLKATRTRRSGFGRTLLGAAAIGFSYLAATIQLQAQAPAPHIYILTEDGKLATASTQSPAGNTVPVTITGVTTGDTLVSIDVRPQNQRLYALGVSSANDTVTLYLLAPETGFATAVGAPVQFTTDGVTPVQIPDTGVDMDFNTAADRIRVVASSGLNLRLNPNNGAGVDGDNTGLTTGTVTGTNPDGPVNTGTTSLNGAAYTNNQPNNGNLTTLYTLDAASNSLFIQNPPNAGTQILGQAVTLNGATLDFTDCSFDIAPGVNVAASNAPVLAGSGFFAATVGGTTSLYSINLVNAQATLLGALNLATRSIAVRTELGAALALTADGASIIRFNPSTPGTTTTVATSGVTAGETLVGVDGRPQRGQLMGLGVNATANTATLYLVDPQSGACTVVGTASQIAFVDGAGAPVDLPDPSVGYGFDFNPTVDRIRVVAGNGLNFRLNPNTGAAVDGDLGGAAGSVAGVNTDGLLSGGATSGQAAAYTNSFGQNLTAGVTTLYILDSGSDSLYIQNPPNAGVLTAALPITLAGAPLDFTAATGFDIPPPVAVATSNAVAVGEGWFLTNIGGVTGVFRLDLSTGAATSFGGLGAGATSASGLVLWASAPAIVAESPAGTVLVDNSSTIDFGGSLIGAPVTRTITVRNRGSQTLNYTTTVDGGPAAYTVSTNPSGSIAGSGSTTIDVTFTPTQTGVIGNTLHILSNDPALSSFEITLTGSGILPLTNDIVTVTTGDVRLNPLANDDLGGTLTITAVSDPAITILGRTLIIPDGYTGTFTYTVSNGTTSGQATVTVVAGTTAVNPSKFNGVLVDSIGKVVGWANVSISSKGSASVSLIVGTQKSSRKLKFETGSNTATGETPLGTLTLTRNDNGTVVAALAGTSNSAGTLHAAVSTATAANLHIALASIDAAIPGGGYFIADISKKGAVKITGILPDGNAVSAGTTVADNGSIAFFAAETKKTKPPGMFGGEFTPADLDTTDVTGELVWSKPTQTSKAKGTQLDGVDTVLTARGSFYNGQLNINNLATLTLSGGNLTATESADVNVTNGIPDVPTGSLTAWSGVKAKDGKFKAKVQVPTVTKPVNGSGIYLTKSGNAWGYFPGTTVGGRIELEN